MRQQPDAHSVIIMTLGEVIGVSILAILADSSDTFGKVAVAIMIGWLFIFLIINAPWLQSLTTKL